MNADAAGGLAHASADLEQSCAQRLDLRRAPRLRKLQQAKQVDQVVGEAMQEQAEGVGQKTVTAEPVGVKTVFELLDTVFAFAAIVVKSKDLGSAAGTVSDEEAQVGARGGMLGFVADAALMRPAASTMAKTGEAALRNSSATIAAGQTFLPRLGAALEDRVGGNAQCILDSEKLAKLIQERQSETGIAAQLDRHARKSGLESWHQPQQHRNNAGMTGGIARSQPCGQQASGVPLKDEHGVVHMLAVGAVENAELLLAMRGIVGGVDIEQDLAALADLLSAEANELIEQGIVQEHQIAGRRRILPATERGLGAERCSQLPISDDL